MNIQAIKAKFLPYIKPAAVITAISAVALAALPAIAEYAQNHPFATANYAIMAGLSLVFMRRVAAPPQAVQRRVEAEPNPSRIDEAAAARAASAARAARDAGFDEKDEKDGLDHKHDEPRVEERSIRTIVEGDQAIREILDGDESAEVKLVMIRSLFDSSGFQFSKMEELRQLPLRKLDNEAKLAAILLLLESRN